jgi:hypothetical protein
MSVDDQIRYREYAEDLSGITVKHRVAEIHASEIHRLTKVWSTAPSNDPAQDERAVGMSSGGLSGPSSNS